MKTTSTTQQKDISGSYVTPDGKAHIDFGITYRNGYAEFHASGHFDGSAGQCIDEIESSPYGVHKEIAQLAQNWRFYHLKQVNQKVVEWCREFAAKHPARSFYHAQADQFLTTNGLKMRVTLSDSRAAAWQPAGHHYRVCLWRINDRRSYTKPKEGASKLTFDFWGSIADAEKGIHPHAYDVLACLSSDAYCPDTFSDWRSEYGEDADSLKALQTFRRCSAFAKRLQSFFTAAELDQLAEIR